MASSVNNSTWLEWISQLMGGVSRQTCPATLPPDRFHCFLDELPLHLVPRATLKDMDRCIENSLLFLNPECRIFPASRVPDELSQHHDLLSGFASQGAIAWVRHPSSDIPLPFWLGPGLEALVASLSFGEPVPDSFPAKARSVLSHAGILISHGLSRARIAPDDALARAGRMFRKRGYAPLCDLIHPFHVAALRRYYRYRIRMGAIRLGDGQSPRRYVAHNDPVARFFHHRIARTLSTVAGEPVKPSYVYLASYQSGAELKKHVDREQCEFSITLCLDFSPEPELATPWPIHLDTPTGTVTVYQRMGEGLAYRGTRLPHYRGKLAEGQTSTSIFFHYVSAGFTGPLD